MTKTTAVILVDPSDGRVRSQTFATGPDAQQKVAEMLEDTSTVEAVRAALSFDAQTITEATAWIRGHALSQGVRWEAFEAKLKAESETVQQQQQRQQRFSVSSFEEEPTFKLPLMTAAATSTEVIPPALATTVRPAVRVSDDVGGGGATIEDDVNGLKEMLKLILQGKADTDRTLRDLSSIVSVLAAKASETPQQHSTNSPSLDLRAPADQNNMMSSTKGQGVLLPSTTRPNMMEDEHAARARRFIEDQEREKAETDAALARGLVSQRRSAAGDYYEEERMISRVNNNKEQAPWLTSSSLNNSSSSSSGSISGGNSSSSDHGNINIINSSSGMIKKIASQDAAQVETDAEALLRRRREREVASKTGRGVQGTQFDANTATHPFLLPRLRELRATATKRGFRMNEPSLEEALIEARSTHGALIPGLNGLTYLYKCPTQLEIQNEKMKRNVNHSGFHPGLALHVENPDEYENLAGGPRSTKPHPGIFAPVTFKLARRLLDSLDAMVLDLNNTWLDVGGMSLLPQDAYARISIVKDFVVDINCIMAKYDTAANPIEDNKLKVVIQAKLCVFLMHRIAMMGMHPSQVCFDIQHGADSVLESWSEGAGKWLTEWPSQSEERRRQDFMSAIYLTNTICSKCYMPGQTLQTCSNGECKVLRDEGDVSIVARKRAEDDFAAWKLSSGRAAATELDYEAHIRATTTKKQWKFPPKAGAAGAAAPSMDLFTRFCARQDLIPCPKVPEAVRTRYHL